jgi:hypothetical protein
VRKGSGKSWGKTEKKIMRSAGAGFGEEEERRRWYILACSTMCCKHFHHDLFW